MKIGVEVNDFFRRYGSRVGKFELEIEENMDVLTLLQKLNIPADKVGFVIVNQKKVDNTYIFSDNDSVYITPFATGG
ncbi:thiamine biosynthesis protein ThiS [Caldicellulosiruptor changbaiensis]|uniref:Thiamine biosynthesis protein ThiS n=1 Tax=Caldicellulosiruptor changbaiensis TaxID=1222016 RepID=A0A3T0D782_9FIRM|nr:MoaD/ThiS family protein [Caldicellulosiruptor changbaiensis]AZT90957.1 thiamine biosynthesis protein ThiS [Caldicellulosiruptor changbaiensis]